MVKRPPSRGPSGKAGDLGARLRALRSASGLTLKQVGERIGKTETGYHYYEVGKTSLALTDVPKFAKAFGLPVGQFIQQMGLDLEGTFGNVRRVGPVVEVPLVRGLRASAGTGSGYGWVYDAEEFVRVDTDLWRAHPELVALQVSGDCLEPEVSEDDRILVDPALLEPQPGELVLVALADGELQLKRYQSNGETLLVDNRGRSYRPSEAQIQGVVVAVQRRYR